MRNRTARMSKGFTLIELLVVVAIIGVITAIAIPALQTAVDKSKQRATMADMRGLATGIQLYQIDHSIFPSDGTPATTLVDPAAALHQDRAPRPTMPGTTTTITIPTALLGILSSRSARTGSMESTSRRRPDYQFELDLVYATGRFSNAPD